MVVFVAARRAARVCSRRPPARPRSGRAVPRLLRRLPVPRWRVGSIRSIIEYTSRYGRRGSRLTSHSSVLVFASRVASPIVQVLSCFAPQLFVDVPTPCVHACTSLVALSPRPLQPRRLLDVRRARSRVQLWLVVGSVQRGLSRAEWASCRTCRHGSATPRGIGASYNKTPSVRLKQDSLCPAEFRQYRYTQGYMTRRERYETDLGQRLTIATQRGSMEVKLETAQD